MGDVIPFPIVGLHASEVMLLKSLPENLLTCIVTGYTDLRLSIPGLSQIIEEEFEEDMHSLCMYFFCGRRVDRFKMLMYDGDGYIVMSKWFDSRRLKWPRQGGKEGDLWILTYRQLEAMMAGKYEPTEEDVTGADEPSFGEAPKNDCSNTLYRSMIRTQNVPNRIFLRTGYTDLRCSIGRYCEIVERFGLDPQADTFYLFCGKRANLLKVMYYDGSGYLLFTKRFDNTRLRWPRKEDEMWDVVYSSFWDLLHGKEPTAVRAWKPKS